MRPSCPVGKILLSFNDALNAEAHVTEALKALGA